VPCTSRALFRGGIELRRFDEAIVYRTKVWEYPGVNTFRTGRLDELAMHPTVKPVAMLADAIRDVTKRGAVVLDPFAGSGSTLIAAEKAGRRVPTAWRWPSGAIDCGAAWEQPATSDE